MTIGIDARFFGPKAKGLGRYTQKLIEELEKTDDKNDYRIFMLRANFDEYRPQNPRFKKILADYRWYSLAEQIFFPLKLYRQKIDLMHFTHFNAPILYFRPYVVTIHDLILRQWPTVKNNFFSRVKYFFKNFGYRIIIRLVLSRAKKIIAVSQFVKKDIIKSFGVAEEKINLIHEGAPSGAVIANRQQAMKQSHDKIAVRGIAASPLEELGAPRNDDSCLEKYGIKKPYLLYVGNAYPHKNLERLIGAFKLLVDSGRGDLQLVLAGEEEYFYRRLKEKSNASILQSIEAFDRIIFTGFVPDDELGALYQDAALYVFPSLCEGFGLPPLEAMAHGVPVASARSTCLPEILGEAAHYFDAQNPADMAVKIGEILSNDALRQKLIAQGFLQAKKYSWRQMAEETILVYNFVD